MNLTVDITNPRQIRELLKPLKADNKPLWGNMSAQQMVEHLIEQTRYTNGTLAPYLDVTPEEAQERKQRAKENDGPMRRNVNLGPLAETYEFSDIRLANDQLIVELEKFDKHFATPGRKEIHGGFGPMNREEWIWWHNKHYTHHFTQFGLIPE